MVFCCFCLFVCLKGKMADNKEPGTSSTKGRALLTREQKSLEKEQMASEKIDSTHFKRQENISIARGEVGKGPHRQKWQSKEEEAPQVETRGQNPLRVKISPPEGPAAPVRVRHGCSPRAP